MRAAHRRVRHLVEITGDCFVVHRLARELGERQDHSEDVVEVVGEPGGQPAQHLQPLALRERGLRRPLAGDVQVKDQDVGDPAAAVRDRGDGDRGPERLAVRAAALHGFPRGGPTLECRAQALDFLAGGLGREEAGALPEDHLAREPADSDECVVRERDPPLVVDGLHEEDADGRSRNRRAEHPESEVRGVALESDTDRRQQRSVVERLQEVAVRGDLSCASDGVVISVRGQKDDRHVSEQADRPRGLDAVNRPADVDIHQDEVGLTLLEERDRLVAVVGDAGDVEAGTHQPVLKVERDHGLVLDHEDAKSSPGAALARVVQGAACDAVGHFGSARGRSRGDGVDPISGTSWLRIG